MSSLPIETYNSASGICIHLMSVLVTLPIILDKRIGVPMTCSCRFQANMVSNSFETATVIGVMKFGLVYVPIPVFSESTFISQEN